MHQRREKNESRWIDIVVVLAAMFTMVASLMAPAFAQKSSGAAGSVEAKNAVNKGATATGVGEKRAGALDTSAAADPAADAADEAKPDGNDSQVTVTSSSASAGGDSLPGETYEQRQTRLNEALQLANAEAMDHFDMSRFYLSQWDLELCEVELETAIMHSPTLKIAHRDYCLVALLRGNPMRSVAELMLVVGLGEPIPLTAEESEALKKRAAKLHYRKALQYGKENRWDNAISEIQWALSYQPDSAAFQRSLAFAYASHGDFDLAEKTYAESFESNPDDAYSHADFAYMLSNKGQDKRALSQMAEAIKLAPNSAALHVDMAWLAETKGDFSSSEAELKEAIKIMPNYAGLWAHLGRVYERQGKNSDAKGAYERAIVLDGGQAEAKRRLEAIKAGIGNQQEKAGDHENAGAGQSKDAAAKTGAAGKASAGAVGKASAGAGVKPTVER